MNSWTLLRTTGVIRTLRDVQLSVLRADGRLRTLVKRPPADPHHSLRIVAFSPTYLPSHRRGAEVTLHAVLTELRDRGHEVRVLTDPGGTSETIDGIEVVVGADRANALRHGRWADVVIGQLAARWRALCVAARADRPMVYFMHIGNVSRRALYGNPDLTVFNSEFLRGQHAWIRRALVVHPPVNEADYLCTPGDAITLVNVTEAKGASVFFELARRLPEYRFVGVLGWGPQDVPTTIPANVTIVEQVTDMRDVYRRTRILLMPSVYESYGRVALEAAVTGIPTIAHPTAGVREAMGDAVLWADRVDVDAWIEHIRQLDDPTEYATRSRRAREQFERLDPKQEIDELERALLGLRRGRAR